MRTPCRLGQAGGCAADSIGRALCTVPRPGECESCRLVRTVHAGNAVVARETVECERKYDARGAPKDACAAKRQYKRALCELSIRRGHVKGGVERCLRDPAFMGSTVRNGGVGR